MAKSSRHFCTLFGAFPHFFTLFQSFAEFFLQDFLLEVKGFTTVLAQRDEKRIKENKKKKTKPFCTSVVAHLSSSKKGGFPRIDFRLHLLVRLLCNRRSPFLLRRNKTDTITISFNLNHYLLMLYPNQSFQTLLQ